jgi:hypothetical protein
MRVGLTLPQVGDAVTVQAVEAFARGAELLGFGFPKRSSRSISEIIEPEAVTPGVVVTVVIDGGWVMQ